MHRSGLIDKILANKNIIKCGVGIADDAKKLFDDWQINVVNCVELNHLNLYPNDDGRGRVMYTSLKKLCEQVLGYPMKMKSKKMTMSNWAKQNLKPKQIMYAAEDAMIGYLIFDKLLKDNPDASVTVQNIEKYLDRRIVNSGYEQYREEMEALAMDPRYKKKHFETKDFVQAFRKVNGRFIKGKYCHPIDPLIAYYDQIFKFEKDNRWIKCLL